MKGKWKWVVIAVVALAVIGAVASNDDKASSTSAASSDGPTASSQPVSNVYGKVRGKFHRDCLSCYGDDLSDQISTGKVWCGWKDDEVVVHLRMTNYSVEHVTVSWHPSYTISGGAGHGEGISSVQDSGFDAGETRDLLVEQSPEGVTPGSAIGVCKPSFYLVESG